MPRADMTCSASQHTCKVTGKCIPQSWTCDSDLDCGEGDSSDEHDSCGESDAGGTGVAGRSMKPPFSVLAAATLG